MRGINSEGLKRRGFTTDQIRNIRNAYRITFRQNKRKDETNEEIAQLVRTQPELHLLLESLRSSERGLTR